MNLELARFLDPGASRQIGERLERSKILRAAIWVS